VYWARLSWHWSRNAGTLAPPELLAGPSALGLQRIRALCCSCPGDPTRPCFPCHPPQSSTAPGALGFSPGVGRGSGRPEIQVLSNSCNLPSPTSLSCSVCACLCAAEEKFSLASKQWIACSLSQRAGHPKHPAQATVIHISFPTQSL